MILLVRESTRTSEGCLPHNGTHTLSKPNTRPEHASPGKLNFETTLFVNASIRCRVFGFEVANQTVSPDTRIQSGCLPTLNLAVIFSDATGT